MYDEYRRPSVVTAAAVLLFISGGASVLIGLLGLSVSAGHGGVALLSLLVMAIGITWIVLTNKIRHGSNGARITVIVLLSISCVLSLGDLDNGGIVSIGLNLLVIGLLAWNRDAQEYFRNERRPWPVKREGVGSERSCVCEYDLSRMLDRTRRGRAGDARG